MTGPRSAFCRAFPTTTGTESHGTTRRRSILKTAAPCTSVTPSAATGTCWLSFRSPPPCPKHLPTGSPAMATRMTSENRRCYRRDRPIGPSEAYVAPDMTCDSSTICTDCAEVLYERCGHCGRLYRIDADGADPDLFPDCLSDIEEEAQER